MRILSLTYDDCLGQRVLGRRAFVFGSGACLDQFHDAGGAWRIEATYGSNYPRLPQFRKQYDPRALFVPIKVSDGAVCTNVLDATHLSRMRIVVLLTTAIGRDQSLLSWHSAMR